MNHPNSLLGLLLVAAIVLASWPAAAETASNATDAYAAASTAIDLLPTGVGYVGVSVTAASIAFTPDGTPVVAHPAYLPLAQANHGFLLSVSGIPQDLLGEAATVRLLASGTVVGVQSIDTLVAGSLLPLGRAAAGADPAPQRNDNVLFTDIAIATPDSYQVEVDDANGVALLTSDAFSLLSADPLATGNANVNPTQVPDKPVQWSAIPPSQQPEAAAGPSTAPAADAACYVTNQYTWSKQGSATWAP
ncbi:MAG: hypothetical protein QOI63_1764, partial [Thermoplasmata archaeon]|nr:hypothetical protein [Thermoplasmata archaeon]